MSQLSEKTIFFDALELNDPAARGCYLDQVCANNPELRQSVDALLYASEQANHFIDQPPVKLSSPAGETTPDEWVGSMLGPYRLMEQIGEGGFGLVFVAQQESPVRRKVALKVIKPGMGTRQILARFEAERQAVAMMDHPNIARVFDAGVAEDGRPYFAMELVRGVPITVFADAHRMTIQQRIELFCDVCFAVHHAHQKGVIHRDIKPSNVMVTVHDDRPVAKVIDFGVAKAIGQSLTDKTIYTRFYSMIGTPLYMSPEQAEMSDLDVDTRSDIYSLGVLLYELLAGATPFDRDRLDSAGLDEMRRIIREEEPLRPSKRMTTLGTATSTVSAARRIEPNRLSSTLRGDLDLIAMKALEKNRNRRYDSAAAMAADLKRYLQQQPIEARPPSASYQTAKFARRHRMALSTGSLILLTMMIGTGVSIWQRNQAITQRDQKEAALREIESFADKVTQANALIASAQTHVESQQWDLAARDYNLAVTQQPSYYLPWVSRAQFFVRRQQWNAAADDYGQALQLGSPTDTPQWWGVPALFLATQHQSDFDAFMQRYQQRLETDPANLSPLSLEWEWLRNGLAMDRSLTPESFQKIADLAEAKLASSDRPRRPGNMLEFGFPNGPHRFPPPPRGRGDEQAPPRDPNRSRLGRHDFPENLPRPVCLYATGLAHLRAGNLKRAVNRLCEAESGNWPGRGLVHAPLAMSYHQLDQPEEAIAQLERSRIAVDALAKTGAVDRKEPTPPWFDDIEMVVLYQQALQLISAESSFPQTHGD